MKTLTVISIILLVIAILIVLLAKRKRPKRLPQPNTKKRVSFKPTVKQLEFDLRDSPSSIAYQNDYETRLQG